ncbi:phage tail protein [Chromobacterium sp. F49]|nr:MULTISPECIES: phage major tail tube protein [Chromobacterium]KUM02927.1 phage tail protein [Chromobacterium subtsugae]KZE84142.1 phage tail protein [Chromobacterium sp. F49]OBU86000.1 tail protein [Chromobacterium subtsugae]WSE93650.1 phage major tail tube protein [Chromobacterium subtsugae]WVH62027.1 phage major tail tube protein [Chromobacterium subtsugae]
MAVQVNNIVNANIYLGGNNLLGCAEEIKLPVLKAVMKDHKALGMFGKLKLPAGFEALEGDIKWSSFYLDAFRAVANPLRALQLMCRSNVESWNAQGLSQERELVTLLTVSFQEFPLGSFKQHEQVDFPSKFTATYIKQTLAGQDVVELDVMSNIFRVGGEDMLANYRSHIGA